MFGWCLAFASVYNYLESLKCCGLLFQTRNLLSVFEKDAMVLRKYSVGLHNCCQRVMTAQNELCAANQALSQHLRSYELQVGLPLLYKQFY